MKLELHVEEKVDGCKLDKFVALKYNLEQCVLPHILKSCVIIINSLTCTDILLYIIIQVKIGAFKYCIIKVEVTITPLVTSIELMTYQVQVHHVAENNHHFLNKIYAALCSIWYIAALAGF